MPGTLINNLVLFINITIENIILHNIWFELVFEDYHVCNWIHESRIYIKALRQFWLTAHSKTDWSDLNPANSGKLANTTVAMLSVTPVSSAQPRAESCQFSASSPPHCHRAMPHATGLVRSAPTHWHLIDIQHRWHQSKWGIKDIFNLTSFNIKR